MSQRLAARRAAVPTCLVAVVAAVGLTAANASAAPAPIKVGSVLTEGGSVGHATTASKTLKAFFKDYNAKGGFKGRKIDVKIVNDGVNAEKNVAGTKQLIDNGVVALIGNQAIFNCLGQADLLKKANLYALGYGNQTPCYSLKQWGSVSASIHAAVALSGQYQKERIGGKVCLIAINIPGASAVWRRGEQILANLGTKFAYSNTNIAPTADPTAALLEAKKTGCRSVQVVLSPAQSVQIVNAKKTQGITGMDLVLASSYDAKSLKAMGRNAEGNFFFSFLYPFTQNDARSKAYRGFVGKHGITSDFFAEQAYVSAQLFVKALGSIKGSVTRQSVGAAIAKLDTTNSLLPGGRFKFGGQGTSNAPVTGGYMLQVKNGKFVLAPKAERLLPSKARSLAGKL